MLERKLFSPEHDMFRESVRRFIADEIKPHHDDWQKAGITPRSLWEKAGEAGLLCPTVPEAYGGYGADFLYSAIVIEELAKANTPDIAFYTHSDIATPYLIDFGTEEQKRTLLPDMVAGRKICSLGMSEPDAGSDVASIKTSAVRDGDELIMINSSHHASIRPRAVHCPSF